MIYFGDFKIDTRKWNLRKSFPKCISLAILRVSNKGEKWEERDQNQLKADVTHFKTSFLSSPLQTLSVLTCTCFSALLQISDFQNISVTLVPSS